MIGVTGEGGAENNPCERPLQQLKEGLCTVLRSAWGGRRVGHPSWKMQPLLFIEQIREVSVQVARFLTQNFLGYGPSVVVAFRHKPDGGWDLPTIKEPWNFVRSTPETFGA